MNSIETIKEVCGLLEAGHVMEADNTIRRRLATMKSTDEHFLVMDRSAQLIWPNDEPKEALALLRAYMETEGNRETP